MSVIAVGLLEYHQKVVGGAGRYAQLIPPSWVTATPAQPLQPVLPSAQPWVAETKLAAATPNPGGSGLLPVGGGEMGREAKLSIVVAFAAGVDGVERLVATSRQVGAHFGWPDRKRGVW